MIQLLFYLPIVIWKKQPLTGVPGERLLLLARGAIGFTAFALTYVAFRMIPLGDVVTIVFSSPIYVSIFACIFLSESCGLFQLLTISLTICGTLLISKPTFLFTPDTNESETQVHLRTEGTIIALVASLLLSLTYIIMRKLRKTSTAVIITVFSLESITFGILVLTMLSTVFHEDAGQFAKGIGLPKTMRDAFLLCCNGICGCCGLLLMTVAMKIEEAGPMALVRSVDIVLAFLLQIAFLPDEVVHWTSLLGALLVCCSVLISGLRRWLKDKPGTCDMIWLLLTCGEERKEKDSVKFSPESAVLTDNEGTSVGTVVDVNKNDSNFIPPAV
jgi:drug/metabolite transporter (DMT)-like permease